MIRFGRSLAPLNWVTDEINLMYSDDSNPLKNDKEFMKKVENGYFIKRR
jgi:hypothetical protein